MFLGIYCNGIYMTHTYTTSTLIQYAGMSVSIVCLQDPTMYLFWWIAYSARLLEISDRIFCASALKPHPQCQLCVCHSGFGDGGSTWRVAWLRSLPTKRGGFSPSKVELYIYYIPISGDGHPWIEVDTISIDIQDSIAGWMTTCFHHVATRTPIWGSSEATLFVVLDGWTIQVWDYSWAMAKCWHLTVAPSFWTPKLDSVVITKTDQFGTTNVSTIKIQQESRKWALTRRIFIHKSGSMNQLK